jgi:hypothetical protein
MNRGQMYVEITCTFPFLWNILNDDSILDRFYCKTDHSQYSLSHLKVQRCYLNDLSVTDISLEITATVY